MSKDQGSLKEAAAFLDLFVTSDWASCHVRGDTIEIFVAREPGHANPMLEPVEAKEGVVDADETILTAPHIGTLVELAAIGSAVSEGGRYGAVEVLGERSDLVATRDGTLRRHIGRMGDLVEYDQPLAAIG